MKYRGDDVILNLSCPDFPKDPTDVKYPTDGRWPDFKGGDEL